MAASLRAEHHPDCYPSDLRNALAFFASAFKSVPPLPAEPPASTLAGIITPHIDFRVSLPAYAAAFQPLLHVPLAETYIILGVGHRSSLEWNLDRRDYRTPLGKAACATPLVDQLAAGQPSARLFSPEAHEGEHSIEFALLWLQALHRLHAGHAAIRSFRFVPLLCGGLHDYVEGLVEWEDLEEFHHLSAGLGKILEQHSRDQKLRLIISIDGCHLGPRFRHPFPVTSVLLKVTEGWEQKLWDCAARGDVRAFLDWFRTEGNDRYFDGVGALALLMAAGKGNFSLQRTFYQQWFTKQDVSAVTFSSGRVLCR